MLIWFGSSMGFERNGVLHLKKWNVDWVLSYDESKFILEMYN